MSNERSHAPSDQHIFDVARYVGIPGTDIEAFVRALAAVGYHIAPLSDIVPMGQPQPDAEALWLNRTPRTDAYAATCSSMDDLDLAHMHELERDLNIERWRSEQFQTHNGRINGELDSLREQLATAKAGLQACARNDIGPTQEQWKAWAEYACRRFKEETGKDLQTQGAT